MGPIEQSLALQSFRDGEPLPDRIENAPELQFGLYFYLQAFIDLDSERVNGMSKGAIPHSAIRKYAKWARLDKLSEYCLLHHIRVMDADHLKRMTEKQKQEDKQNAAKSKRPRKNVR